MQRAFAEMAKKISQKSSPQQGSERKIHSEGMALAGCYGQIGISAVAAAVRYQGSGKNPAYAPTSNKWRDRIAEAAA
jgi:hypothetical protein